MVSALTSLSTMSRPVFSKRHVRKIRWVCYGGLAQDYMHRYWRVWDKHQYAFFGAILSALRVLIKRKLPPGVELTKREQRAFRERRSIIKRLTMTNTITLRKVLMLRAPGLGRPFMLRYMLPPMYRYFGMVMHPTRRSPRLSFIVNGPVSI